jgi:hypothetical protein
MQHPVVAGVQKHGHCGTASVRIRVNGAHVGLHEAYAALSLMNGGHAKLRQLVYSSGIRTDNVALDDSHLMDGVAHKSDS